jgi:hypothetical protein
MRDLADFNTESANNPEAIAKAPCVNDKKERNTNIMFDDVKVLMRQAKKCCIGTETLTISMSLLI